MIGIGCTVIIERRVKMSTRYIGTWESVKQHKVPDWFDNAKLGIFIHWGLYSVPAFAPKTVELGEIPGDSGWYCNNPYAEWYFNSVNVGQGPVWEHHIDKYGSEFTYENFIPMWKAERWDPDEWARLFSKAGAKYVILTTKHHDGFCLFPSDYTNYTANDMGPKRNIMGELTSAVRNKGMRMGAYYSGLVDWKFSPIPIFADEEHYTSAPQTFEYSDYVFNQVNEIIEKYRPDVLWNDLGWPILCESKLPQLFSTYYNKVEDGVVNDRWNDLWHDFVCTEYNIGKSSSNYKWEHCRGLGLSFGINNEELESDYLDKNSLIRLFVKIVTNNGNLLINVGPNADGTINDVQKQRLLDLGAWIDINGEAIFDTEFNKDYQEYTTNSAKIHFSKKLKRDYVFINFIHPEKLNERINIKAPNKKLRALDPEVIYSQETDEDGIDVLLSSLGNSSPSVVFEII